MRFKSIMTSVALVSAVTLGFAPVGSMFAANQDNSVNQLPLPGALKNADTQIAPDETMALQNTQPANIMFPTTTAQEALAFNALTKQTLPLSPAEIIKLHRMLDLTQQAAAASPTTPPVPVVTTRIVNLGPGVLPPVIRLTQGFVTSLVFVDSTGAAWPIESYQIGNAQAFTVQPPQTGGNLLMIQSMTPYTYGNVAVKLKDLVTPVILTLIPGQKEVDYRVDLYIQQLGPQAQPVTGNQGLPMLASDVLLSVLNGITPPDSRLLHLSNPQITAWVSDQQLYLRTNLIILSPGWLSMMSSADGMRAYILPVSPKLLVLIAGKPTDITIEDL